MRRTDRKEIRRNMVAERVDERAKRTPEEQLEILDRRVGKDGAGRERARLLSVIREKENGK